MESRRCRRSFFDFEFEKTEIDAVKEENFVTVSLDIPATVITVQGAYPELVALRPQFVQHLASFDITKLEKLEIYALSMFCAHADYEAATEPPASLVELVSAAIGTRSVLLADVNSLIAHGLLASGVIAVANSPDETSLTRAGVRLRQRSGIEVELVSRARLLSQSGCV